ncbi:hypothetical protein [Sphingomonas sp. NPDC079357]|uniref:hypothetical protein n=1 Tax=Sphingomonas sp. NPDC079357 TaxID=3364518 RepID=UPI00384C468A
MKSRISLETLVRFDLLHASPHDFSSPPKRLVIPMITPLLRPPTQSGFQARSGKQDREKIVAGGPTQAHLKEISEVND